MPCVQSNPVRHWMHCGDAPLVSQNGVVPEHAGSHVVAPPPPLPPPLEAVPPPLDAVPPPVSPPPPPEWSCLQIPDFESQVKPVWHVTPEQRSTPPH
jgi:hypothetical protein